MAVIDFKVVPEPEGGFTASSQQGTHSLVTYGATLDELHTMLLELLELYAENSGTEIESFALRFAGRIPQAA
jgi:hypothetical protein